MWPLAEVLAGAGEPSKTVNTDASFVLFSLLLSTTGLQNERGGEQKLVSTIPFLQRSHLPSGDNSEKNARASDSGSRGRVPDLLTLWPVSVASTRKKPRARLPALGSCLFNIHAVTMLFLAARMLGAREGFGEARRLGRKA